MPYELIVYPDPILKQKSLPLTSFNQDELKALGDSMVEAMVNYGGIGLAAVQVGKLIRFMLMRITVEDKIVYIGMCNPDITRVFDKPIFGIEGCLSFPGIRAEVYRPESIEVKWYNIAGEEHISLFNGIEARCVQHEIDHMDGILFINKLNDLNRFKVQGKLTDLKRAYNNAGH